MCKHYSQDGKNRYCRCIEAYPVCLDQPEEQCELKAKLTKYAPKYIPPSAPVKAKLI
jgi:hypothetical protein